MNIVWIVEFVVIALVTLFFITQLLIPTLLGRPLLPMFRKEWKLQKELEEARQEEVERELEQCIDQKKADINTSKE